MDNLQELLANPTVQRIAVVLIGLVVINIVVRLVQRALSNRVSDFDTRYRLRKSVTAVGYVGAALFVATMFSDRLSTLSVTLGVAGAGIAFALQEVIASIAGWVALSLSSFYRVGDRIQLGGIRGDVIDVGLLRTTLMECGEWIDGDLYNGRIVRVANSFVFKEPVFNYSADFHFLWDELRLPIAYGSDRAAAEALIRDVAEAVIGVYAAEAQVVWQQMMRKYRIVAAETHPSVTLVATDNWLQYTLRYVVDYTDRRRIRSALFTQLLDAIDRSDGRVRLASTTLQLVDLPPLDVRLTGGNGAAPR